MPNIRLCIRNSIDTNTYNIKINNILLLLLTISLSIGCNQESKQKRFNKFNGLWSLHIMEQLNSETGEWSEYKEGVQGYILYDDIGNMAVHITAKDYENTDLRFPFLSDTLSNDALIHRTQSFVYFAKYTVFESSQIVEHARISHSNPGQWNQVVTRKFTFSGDTLILEPMEKSYAGMRLKWIKESASNKK